MARDLDLTLVRTFVLSAEHASMTVAARVLHRTQGAVSQHIKRLEEALGASLFDRGPKGLRPTPFAERFLPKARQILAERRDLVTDERPNGERPRSSRVAL